MARLIIRAFGGHGATSRDLIAVDIPGDPVPCNLPMWAVGGITCVAQLVSLRALTLGVDMWYNDVYSYMPTIGEVTTMKLMLLVGMLFLVAGCQGDGLVGKKAGMVDNRDAEPALHVSGIDKVAQGSHSSVAREIMRLGEEQQRLEGQLRDMLVHEAGLPAALEARDVAVERFRATLSMEQALLFSSWLKMSSDEKTSQLALVERALELVQSLNVQQFTEFEKIRQLQHDVDVWTTKVRADARPLVRRHSAISDRILHLAGQYYGR